MVSWWGRVRRNGKANIRGRRELALGGWMEFWEISGDLGRPLQVLSLPSHQTTTRQSPLLKLTSSYFYNLHTHAHMRNSNMNMRTRTHTRAGGHALIHTS